MRIRAGSTAITVALLAAATLAGCSSPPTLSHDTLPPLQSGPFATAPTTTAVGTTAPGLPPPPTGLPSTLVAPVTLPPVPVEWGGWPFKQVPPLVSAAERGTGCGIPGATATTLPDGIYNVLVGDGSGADTFFTTSTITVDVRCIYTGIDGQNRWTAACASDPAAAACTGQSPGWFMVNNSRRLRTLPVSPSLQYGVGAIGKRVCKGAPASPTAAAAPWRTLDSWIVVDRGVVSTVVADCPTA